MQCYLVNWFPFLPFPSFLLFSFLYPSFPPFLPYFLSSSFLLCFSCLLISSFLPPSFFIVSYLHPSFLFLRLSFLTYSSSLRFLSLSSTLFYFYFSLFIFPFFFPKRRNTSAEPLCVLGVRPCSPCVHMSAIYVQTEDRNVIKAG